MLFDLDESQKMLKKTVRELSERYIKSRASEIDEKEEYPEDIFDVFA